MLELVVIVRDFAIGMAQADARSPAAINKRSKKRFQPGIGPHSEADTVSLVGEELEVFEPERYAGRWITGVPYPESPRQKCDLCIGSPPEWEWAVEIKMLRFLGDTGKVNDNILMHVLSPYSQHRSALTDCVKLSDSGLGKREAILIYGYDHDDWPLDPAVEAFELLAGARVRLGARSEAGFDNLIHPIHSHGRVFGWELLSSEPETRWKARSELEYDRALDAMRESLKQFNRQRHSDKK